ncbi:MAG: lysylphosphatidylglycerol synthase transmembrane domain-containing protein [Sulfuricella sp.]|nr:lysylphosphatidylglycerol synthase transmembrane domain-containing protein [Sulfuricella sp.]
MSKTGIKILRFIAASFLLAAVIWYANPAKLVKTLSNVELRWFALAVAASILANIASALRWAHIARLFSLTAPALPLIAIYGRGVTINNLLPGATLSGDMLRAYQLHKLGNPLGQSTLSVVLDRFSGLWVLCLVSAAAAALWSGTNSLTHDPALAQKLTIYAALLGSLILLPFLPLPRFEPKGQSKLDGLLRSWDSLTRQLALFRNNLPKTALQSVVVQFFSTLAFWLGGISVGLDISYWLVLALCAPVFIIAALPVGIGGWGTREFAAVLVFGFAGVSGETAAATAILYGLCAVIQGILYAPLFLLPTD